MNDDDDDDDDVDLKWPRHTADFTILRAYVGPDGAAAEYSPENVPYRPASFLRVATEARSI